MVLIKAHRVKGNSHIQEKQAVFMIMVVRLLTSVLLLVLPSLVYGNSITRKVLHGSGSLQLSSSPDRVALSGILNVTVNLTAAVTPDLVADLPLDIEVTDNSITPMYKDKHFEIIRGDYCKSIPVMFNSSSKMPLHEEPIPVRISMSFDNTLVSVTSSIVDNRGKHKVIITSGFSMIYSWRMKV